MSRDSRNRELIARAQAGDREALEAIVAENEGLAKKLALQCAPRCAALEVEDLMQHGRLGLVKAVEGFDPTRGTSFATFATWKIRGEIGSARRKDRLIVIPPYLWEKPEGERVLAGLPMVVASLDEPVAQTSTSRDTIRLGERLPAPDNTEAEALGGLDPDNHALRDAVNRLPHKEWQAITVYYGLDIGCNRTLDEAAALIGISREGVRVRCEAAIRRLRRLMKDER